MSTVAYPHIETTADGHARIRGTGFKVRILAEEYLTGASVEQLREWHPHLTLAQIHSGLAYYYDHKEKFDSEIEELKQFAEEYRLKQGESLLAKKLREMGKELP
jgi:uncharacterized protein (DUF433 family)